MFARCSLDIGLLFDELPLLTEESRHFRSKIRNLFLICSARL